MKTIKVKISILVIFSLILGLFISCTKTNVQSQNKLTVAALIRNNNEDFVKEYTSFLREYAKEQGVELIVYFGNNDAAIQMDQLKTLLSKGIKYYVIIAVDSGITEQFTKLIASRGGAAAFSNIQPSISALKVSKNMFYASSPEYTAGDYQAEILDDYFKKYPQKIKNKTLNIFYLNGEYGHPAQLFRRSSVMESLKQKGYKVNILAEDTANWGYNDAKQLVGSYIKTYANDVDAIIAQNDSMALGAVDALLEIGFTDDSTDKTKDLDGDGIVVRVPIIGIDATADGLKYINENKLLATVKQDSHAQAKTAFELVVEYAKKGEVKGFTTKDGISAATQVSIEDPVTDNAILDQCFVVPFVPIVK